MLTVCNDPIKILVSIRAPVKGRSVMIIGRGEFTRFNPRPREGAISWSLTAVAFSAVSIRAPVKGRSEVVSTTVTNTPFQSAPP